MTMQIPISLALKTDARDSAENSVAAIGAEIVLSIESQLKLRGLYEYMDSCRLALDEIRRELGLHMFEPVGRINMQGATERLERFCVEADSWGFNSLYEVAQGLQMLLLHCTGRAEVSGFRDALLRGLAMIPALLEQCERDFCWRLAIADMLEYFRQVAGDPGTASAIE